MPGTQLGELDAQLFQRRNEIALGDFFNATHDFELGDLVDGIDVVNALLFVQIPLVYPVNADIAESAFGPGLAALADL